MKETLVAEVLLWDRLVGAVAWDERNHVGHFEYDNRFRLSGFEVSPLMMPLRGQDIYTFRQLSEETYQGLPGMLADALPDYFGNQVINAYLRASKRKENSMNPVERLCYIGTRGMGALEFRPAFSRTVKASKMDVSGLASLAAKILQERESFRADLNDKDGCFQEILQVGTSAGGARAKAVIAWNEKTNDVYSGQVKAPKGCDYWLLKFDVVRDGKSYGRIEYLYHLLARACGIEMCNCRIFEDGEHAHFMTKRFDRVNGEKLHAQTLCAMAHLDYNQPTANSYEQAFAVLEELRLPVEAKEQLFRRMVFNIVFRNQDDHTKNISFLMNPKGAWCLAPAYDVTWAYKPNTKWTGLHQLSANGKRDGFKHHDLMMVAKMFDIPSASQVIKRICEVANSIGDFATQAGVDRTIVDAMKSHYRFL